MGGVCKLIGRITRDIKDAPSCTDNFQIIENQFNYDGHKWNSVEQAYQASKFEKWSSNYLEILSSFPGNNESDWDPVRGSIDTEHGNILHIFCKNQLSSAKISFLVIAERKDNGVMVSDMTDSHGRFIPEPDAA